MLQDSPALLQKAQAYQKQRRFADALPLLEQLHRQHPEQTAPLGLMGECLLQTGQLEPAFEALDQATRRQPEVSRWWLQFGHVCRKLARGPLAQSAYQKAVELTPDLAEAWHALGQLQIEQQQFAQAVESLERANRLHPGQPGILNSLARACYEAFELEPAIGYYREALALKTDHPGLWLNLGNAYRQLQAYEDAAACYTQAQSLAPDNPKAGLNLALMELRKGESVTSWRYFRLLRATKNKLRPPAQTRYWDGRIRPDRALVIIDELGLGDSIQMLRFVPRLIALGQPCVVWLQHQGLKRLLETLPVKVPAYDARTGTLPANCSHYLPDSDLPGYFEWLPHSAREQTPYCELEPDPEHQLLEPGPRVAIAWASGYFAERGANWSYRQRSAGLAAFAPLLSAHRDLSFYSLQVGADARQIEAHPGLPLIDLAPRIQDLYDTACFLKQMDLVISVDTAVAHLAGALNLPLWLLLPAAPDWRWGDEGESSPWYPSARLFRQRRLRAWNEVFDQVNRQLSAWKQSVKGYPASPPG